MKKNLFEKIGVLLSIILYLIPHYIAPICDTPANHRMSCFYSGNLIERFALYLLAINLIMILFANHTFGKIIKIIGSIAIIIISSLSYMIPHGIIEVLNETGKPYGFCKMEMMQCVANNTFGLVGTIALIIAIAGISNLIYLFLRRD